MIVVRHRLWNPLHISLKWGRFVIATIYEIAKLLHTSPATVSRALSGTGYVCRKLREQVIQLAKELDYHPNTLARSLTKKASDTIGFIGLFGAGGVKLVSETGIILKKFRFLYEWS